jgi:hypothetical protein
MKPDRAVAGEWLIYGNWEGQNYYLDLGAHYELANQEALCERLYTGCPEFGFCLALWS